MHLFQIINVLLKIDDQNLWNKVYYKLGQIVLLGIQFGAASLYPKTKWNDSKSGDLNQKTKWNKTIQMKNLTGFSPKKVE